MKKLITTLFLTASAIIGFSQSMSLLYNGHDVTSDTIDVYIAPSTAGNNTDILVANISATSLDTVLVKRTKYAVELSDATQFCWGGTCYGYIDNNSGQSVTIPSEDTVPVYPNGFHAIFNAGASGSVRLVHYKFYNKNNTSDSAGVTLRYNPTLGINETSKVNGVISNAYPNPANSSVSIKYDMNEFSQKGRIIFYDVLGKAVKEVILNDKQGVAYINTSDLNTGIYFYKFIIDDKAISTKKLVVSSK